MNSDSQKNVIYRDFGGQGRKPAEPSATQAVGGRSAAIDHLKAGFKGIIRKATDKGWIETAKGEGNYDARRPSYGAYNTFIGYNADGTPNFFIRHDIDGVKDKRKFTRNAIEMRCDALGLAVYVSGITQVDVETRKAKEGVRVAVYHNVDLKPEQEVFAKTAEELVDKLHHILITTYNRLAREYNLAGYTPDFLTLTSSSKTLPSIRIDMHD